MKGIKLIWLGVGKYDGCEGKEYMDVGSDGDLNVSIKKGLFSFDFHKESVLPSGLAISAIFLITKTLSNPNPPTLKKPTPKFLPHQPPLIQIKIIVALL